VWADNAYQRKLEQTKKQMITNHKLIRVLERKSPPKLKTRTLRHHVGIKTVSKITQFFDSLNFRLKEFKTQTDIFKGKDHRNVSRIGPDNIDIVINELELVNIDLETRQPKGTRN
jgi:hypothetical protein